ncbi:hypothetical protein ACN47E_005888 [Coniothyrium glycines]
MDAFSSPLRLLPSLTPRRAPSPTMSPGTRRGRPYGGADETRLRDLSPETTLRAFTQRPMPFDTTRDDYKIFSCIESLTAAERDLGARVAKAAQRLKSWCAEIEQWGWSGSFEQPSEAYREKRRRSIELRIREHVAEADLAEAIPPLEYWGSLLSVEVEQHEARLDDIEDDLLRLDVEELKEFVLDMHPSGRSRPSSADLEATRQNYKPMDDFSFLITQTLLSAMPQYTQLKESLITWSSRVAILREAPRFASDLDTAQNALRLGWEALESPADSSDNAFAQWKEAVDTISRVLQRKVADLGGRLDGMLDRLEGRDDCLPDAWIDHFESIEADFGRWSQDSRRKIIEFDVRRKGGATFVSYGGATTNQVDVQLDQTTTSDGQKPIPSTTVAKCVTNNSSADPTSNSTPPVHANITTNTGEVSTPRHIDHGSRLLENASPPASPTTPSRRAFPDIFVRTTPVSSKHDQAAKEQTDTTSKSASDLERSTQHYDYVQARDPIPKKQVLRVHDAIPPHGEKAATSQDATGDLNTSRTVAFPIITASSDRVSIGAEAQCLDEESEFEEGDTIVHNEFEQSPLQESLTVDIFKPVASSQSQVEGTEIDAVQGHPKPLVLVKAPSIVATDGQDSVILETPQTPRSRRGSSGSVSSEMSFESSPPSNIEESPSIRHAASRAIRAPRPELNAAMTKRRPVPTPAADIVPWPPTSFTQKPVNSAEDLERKISDILTTIPAHIRLTSGPSPDSPEVKPRGLAARGGRGFLRAARSASGLKSPELTLSPAKNEFESAHVLSGRRSAANLRTDNDIKLYHLTQPGKEQPVKLFIRRVGENGERVMVRVGGGWADLGEYLRQYAEHHGRRTASDGKFEILGLEVNNQSESPNRPESAVGRRDRRISGNFPPASPTTTPVKPPGLDTPIEGEAPPMLNFTTTPGIAEEAGIPSTNSSQRSWKGNEVGLAGPNAKRLDLSEEKREWIEGMMKQARTVSGSVISASHTPFQRDERADSRSDSRSDSRASTRGPGKKHEFGDLGKVGGTKRIFFKGGKPYLGEN